MATIVDRRGKARSERTSAAHARGQTRPQDEERPLWQHVCALYAVIVVMIVLFIAAALLVTYLVTGSPY